MSETAVALRDALETLAVVWPEQMGRRLKAAKDFNGIAREFERFKPEEIRQAARVVAMTTENLTASDNVYQTLKNAALNARTERVAACSTTETWRRIHGGGEIRYGPRQLRERLGELRAGRVTDEELGRLYYDAQKWAASDTPCATCKPGNGKAAADCDACRRQHAPLNATPEERDMAVDAMAGGIREAWTHASDRRLERERAERLACGMLRQGAKPDAIAEAIRSEFAHVQASAAIARAAQVAGLLTRIRPALEDIDTKAPEAIGATVEGLRSRNRIVAAAQAAQGSGER